MLESFCVNHMFVYVFLLLEFRCVTHNYEEEGVFKSSMVKNQDVQFQEME